MIKKFLFTSMIFLLLLIPLAFSQDYRSVGGGSGNFKVSEVNKFNSALGTDNSYQYPLTDGVGMPLVSDLDGDNVSEIVVLDNDGIILFHYQDFELTPIDSYDLQDDGVSGSYYSNLVLEDIDGDGFDNIIIHSQIFHRITILSYNGSEISRDKEYNQSYGVYMGDDRTSDSVLGCSPSACIVAYNRYNTFIGGQIPYIYYSSFNLSGMVEGVIWAGVGAGDPNICFPEFGFMTYSSVNDAFYFVGSEPSSDLKIFSLTINNSGHVLNDFDNIGYTYLAPSNNCESRGVDELSSPVVGQLSPSGDEEIVFSFMHDPDEYRYIAYKSDLSELDIFPNSVQVDGVFISNPFFGNFFSTSGDNDVCVLGLDEPEEELVLSCASKSYTFVGYIDNVRYRMPRPYNFNLSFNDRVFSISAHAINSDVNNKADEILTTYGVIQIPYYDDLSLSYKTGMILLPFYGEGSSLVQTIYEQSSEVERAYILADVEGVGYPDMIGMSYNNLAVVDDGYVNQAPYLQYCSEIKPCFSEGAWQLGTKVRVYPVPVDPDGDSVRAMTILNYGETNVSYWINSSWSAWFSSGTTISISSTDNLTPVLEETTLRIIIQDEFYHNSTYDYTYSTEINGTYWTDCSYCAGITEDEYQESIESPECDSDSDCSSLGDDYICSGGNCVYLAPECSQDADCPSDYTCLNGVCSAIPENDDNSVTSGVKNISAYVGIPVILLIFIVLAFFGYWVVKTPEIPEKAKFPIIIIGSLFAIGSAVIMGLLSIVWIILLILFVLGAVGIFVTKLVKG